VLGLCPYNTRRAHAQIDQEDTVTTEFLDRLKRDTEALDAAGLLKRERIIGSAQGPLVVR